MRSNQKSDDDADDDCDKLYVFRTFQPELNRCAEEPERLGSLFTRYVSIRPIRTVFVSK